MHPVFATKPVTPSTSYHLPLSSFRGLPRLFSYFGGVGGWLVLLLPSVLCLPRCSLSLRPGSRGGLQTRASRHKPAGAGCPLGPETGSKRLLLSQLSLETTCPRALRRRRPSGAGRPLPGARGRRPPARPPRPGEEERPRPWPFPLQPLPPARGPVAAGHGGAPGASGPAGGGRAGAGKAGAAGPRGGCPGRAAAAAGREGGGWDPPGRRDEVPGGACGRLRGAAAQPCSAPPLSHLRPCRRLPGRGPARAAGSSRAPRPPVPPGCRRAAAAAAGPGRAAPGECGAGTEWPRWLRPRPPRGSADTAPWRRAG